MVFLTVPYFSTLSHKRHDFRERDLLNIKRVFCFSLQFFSEKFLILKIITRDIVKNVEKFLFKALVIRVTL